MADGVVRLCAMNLHLHGISGDESPVEAKDSLRADPGDRFELILTNPPFGKKAVLRFLMMREKQIKKKLFIYAMTFWQQLLTNN